MPKPRNVIVAQSGGPSPVINNSIRGVVETCFAKPDRFGRVLAAWHGIEGVLKEELLDLSAQPREEIALLRTTPAAGAIGTCRYKLKSSQAEDFERTIEVLKTHDVGYFFYTGGNDSMDTAHKIAKLAAEKGIALIEDAAHAAGTEYRGERVGRTGTSIFSFHPINNMTTGEGGMFCSSDDKLLDRIRRLKFHGLGVDAFDRQTQGRSPQAEALEPGYKYNLTDIAAVLGLGQLARLDEFNREGIAKNHRLGEYEHAGN